MLKRLNRRFALTIVSRLVLFSIFNCFCFRRERIKREKILKTSRECIMRKQKKKIMCESKKKKYYAKARFHLQVRGGLHRHQDWFQPDFNTKTEMLFGPFPALDKVVCN